MWLLFFIMKYYFVRMENWGKKWGKLKKTRVVVVVRKHYKANGGSKVDWQDFFLGFGGRSTCRRDCCMFPHRKQDSKKKRKIREILPCNHVIPTLDIHRSYSNLPRRHQHHSYSIIVWLSLLYVKIDKIIKILQCYSKKQHIFDTFRPYKPKSRP